MRVLFFRLQKRINFVTNSIVIFSIFGIIIYMNGIAISTLMIAILTCLGTVICLLFNLKIKKLELYPVVCVIGAICALLINFKNFNEIVGTLFENTSINPLKILIFFISITILSIVLDNLNFFNLIASKCVKFAKNSQYKLFLIFYALVAVLTIFTSNDIVILAFIPFICYFCKSSNINPVPYVFATFVAANTWSMMLIFGNPTNVYISAFAGISFGGYFIKMVLPTIVCGVVSLGIMLLIFRRFLKVKVEAVTEADVEVNPTLILLNVFNLVLCIIFLAISAYINLDMWIIALIFVTFSIAINVIYSMHKRRNLGYLKNSFKRAPWVFVPFLVSMFLIVMCLNANGITAVIGKAFSSSNSVFAYGFSSFAFSNVMNNIPTTTLFASILQGGTFSLANAYAIIIGSNIGTLLSPIGALGGIMFLKLLKQKGVKFSMFSFIKYGFIISIPSLAATLGVLSAML